MTTSLNKARGSAAEREIAKVLDGIRVGHDGGPTDVVAAGLRVQVKKVIAQPSAPAIGRMLDRIDRDQFHVTGTPAVVVLLRLGATVQRRIYFRQADAQDHYGTLGPPWTVAKGLAMLPLSTFREWYVYT